MQEKKVLHYANFLVLTFYSLNQLQKAKGNNFFFYKLSIPIYKNNNFGLHLLSLVNSFNPANYIAALNLVSVQMKRMSVYHYS